MNKDFDDEGNRIVWNHGPTMLQYAKSKLPRIAHEVLHDLIIRLGYFNWYPLNQSFVAKELNIPRVSYARSFARLERLGIVQRDIKEGIALFKLNLDYKAPAHNNVHSMAAFKEQRL